MLSSSPSPQIAGINDADAWKSLFQALLRAKAIDAPDLQISLQNDSITLLNADPSTEQALRELFTSSQATLSSLNYTLESNELVSRPVPPDLASVNAQALLASLFSPELLPSLGLINGQYQDDEQSQVLRMAIPSQSALLLQIRQDQAKLLLGIILNVGINGLARAYYQPSKLSFAQCPNQELVPNDEVKTLVQIKQSEQGQAVFEFNYGQLLRMIFPCPPKMQSTATGIAFNRAELVTYFSRMFAEEGFMLDVSPQGSARAICFPTGQLTKPANHYAILIDRSISMSKVYHQFMDSVIALMHQIAQHATDKDKVSIVVFDSQTMSQEFSLKNVANIIECLKTLQEQGVKGNTRLHDTVLEQMDSLSQQTHNQTYIIFTDGFNTVGHTTNEGFIEGFNAKISAHKENAPKVFTIGLGEEYQKQFFSSWSNRTGVEHIHLEKADNSAEFDKVMSHVQHMCQARKLVTLAQGLQQVYTSVYEGHIAVPNVLLAPNESFTVSGVTHTFQPGAPMLASSSTYTPQRDGQSRPSTPEACAEMDVDETAGCRLQ